MNPIVNNVITAVATAAIMAVIMWGAGVFEAGTDAIDKEQIRAVLKEEMKTDAGKTYAARISEIDGTLVSLETRVVTLTGDVNDIERDILTLAGE